MHDYRVRVGADDPRDIISDSNRHVPPAFGPRAYSPRRPNLGVLAQSIVRRTRHRAQAVRDQIDSFVQDGEFRTPFEQVVSQAILRSIAC